MERIDEIDAEILRLLQSNGRIKRNQIAETVNLSVPSISDRMRKLEERGVIVGYRAVVDPKRVHFDITAFIRARVDGSQHYTGFLKKVKIMPEVLEVHSITGEGSHMLKVRTRNATTLEQLLSAIQRIEGVHGTQTSIVLSTMKETTALDISPMELASNGVK